MKRNNLENFSWLVSFTPWVVGITASIIITQFLLGFAKWEVFVPWQIRTFSRIFIVIVFVYLLLTAGALFVPDNGKLSVFTDNISLVGDLLKTLIGSIIGALSMSIKSPHTETKDENT